jgi:hypothetical protein
MQQASVVFERFMQSLDLVGILSSQLKEKANAMLAKIKIILKEFISFI